MADYLEAYAARFELPVRTGVRVDGLSREADRYVVTAGDRRLESDQVVVASGAYQSPSIPAFAGELDPSIVQLHSSQYRDPSQLQEGGVLVVGAANSGAEIALELSGEHRTWLSGRHPGQEPVRPGSRWDRLLVPLIWFMASRVVTVNTPIGRIVAQKFQIRGAHHHHGLPLAWVRPKDITAAGIQRVPRTTGVRRGLPVLDDGRDLQVANVIWCTGFVPDFAWIDLPVVAADGCSMYDRGIGRSEPGRISWDWSSCMPWRRRWSVGSEGTLSTLPSTSRHANPSAWPSATNGLRFRRVLTSEQAAAGGRAASPFR